MWLRLQGFVTVELKKKIELTVLKIKIKFI